MSDLNGIYGQLDCTNSIAAQQQAQQIQTVEQVAGDAASTASGSPQTVTSNVMIVVLILLGLGLVVVSAVIIFHHKKQ